MLCACSGASSHVSPAVTRHFKGFPKNLSVPADRRYGPSVYVLTWASGSCPKIPTSVRASGTRLVIRTVVLGPDSDDEACTADLAVTTSVVRLPEGASTTGPLIVQVDGVSTTLPRRG